MKYEIKSKENFRFNIKELWQYRELLFMLTYRDFKIRYAQTFLGMLWTFIQPLATVFIFTLVFSLVVKVDTGNTPYPIFALSGIFAWNYFSYVMLQAGSSIIGSQSIISKIYFPRLIIPLSKSLFGLIDLGVTFVLLLSLMLYFKFIPSGNIIYLPLFIFILIIFSNAMGIWLSALTIRFRDLQNIVPFVIQLGLYITPVAYPTTLIPKSFMFLYYINPMTFIIDGIRWSLTGTSWMVWTPESIGFTLVVIFVTFFTGVYFFRKIESVIADIV